MQLHIGGNRKFFKTHMCVTFALKVIVLEFRRDI